MLQPSAAFMSTARPAAIARWLWFVAALIVAMVIVGGITRLTESGLSITQWKPISGIVPPLTEAQWQAEFDGYKRIPEYAAFNQGMTLAGFKAIFFDEAWMPAMVSTTLPTTSPPCDATLAAPIAS